MGPELGPAAPVMGWRQEEGAGLLEYLRLLGSLPR